MDTIVYAIASDIRQPIMQRAHVFFYTNVFVAIFLCARENMMVSFCFFVVNVTDFAISHVLLCTKMIFHSIIQNK